MGTYGTLKAIGTSAVILIAAAVFTTPATAKEPAATTQTAPDTANPLITDEVREAAGIIKEYRARQKKNGEALGNMVRENAKNGATGSCVIVVTQGEVEKAMAPPMPVATADQMLLAMKGPLKPRKVCGPAGVALWNASINGSK